MKHRVGFALMLLLAVALTAALAASPDSSPAATPPSKTAPQAAATTPEPAGAPHVVRVYYFHGRARCATCLKIEALSSAAVSNGFAQAVRDGKVIWDVVDTDEPENKHFVNDYQLYTKSLIVVDMVGDKQVRWKNLSDIWTLVRDEAAFTRYVQDEVRGYLEGRS